MVRLTAMTLTALDGIALVVVTSGIGALVGFPIVIAPSLSGMFEDFGGELPLITRLALARWFPLVVVGFGVACVGLAVCIAGAPIFELAGAIG